MKTLVNNNNIERLRKIAFIICVPFYACTYKEKGTKRAEKGYQNRDKFFAEIVSILQADGWTLTTMGETLDCGKSTCPELAKGNEHIYCHPEELTGEVQDEKAFAALLKGAASFRIVKKEARDIYVCADNKEGKQLYRDTYRDCIDEVIRDVVYLKTNIYGGRKGDWIDLDSATRIIGERIFIATKSNNDGYNSVTVLREYVTEELCRLQDAGRIEATTNKHGQTVIKWTDGRTLCRWINKKEEKELNKTRRETEKAAKVKETYKTGLLVTDKKFGHDYERITGIEEGMNTYIVTTATKIQVECMKHYRVMEKAENEHTVADLPEWVLPGAVLMINGTWKWEEVVIVELADGCVWYKKGNSVMGWTYDHFISLYVNHHYAKVKEYAPEPTLEDIGKFRAVCEAEGCTYPGDVEGTSEYYRDALLTAEDDKTVSYQFGNCRFDCKRNESGTWDVHAYDTDGEDTTFEGRTASFFGGMFNDLFKTWGSGNLPEPPAEVHIDAA